MKTVDHWSLVPIHCQQESPIWGVVKRMFYSVQAAQQWYSTGCENGTVMKQQGCEGALGRGLSLATQLCFAPLHTALPACSAPARHLQRFSSSGGNIVCSLWWNGKVRSPSQRKADLYRQKSLPLVPDWFILMQTGTLNSCSLIYPPKRKNVLVGQNGAALIGLWRCWWWYTRSFTALIGRGKPQSYWLKYSSRNSFTRAGPGGRNTVQTDSQCRLLPKAWCA